MARARSLHGCYRNPRAPEPGPTGIRHACKCCHTHICTLCGAEMPCCSPECMTLRDALCHSHGWGVIRQKGFGVS